MQTKSRKNNHRSQPFFIWKFPLKYINRLKTIKYLSEILIKTHQRHIHCIWYTACLFISIRFSMPLHKIASLHCIPTIECKHKVPFNVEISMLCYTYMRLNLFLFSMPCITRMCNSISLTHLMCMLISPTANIT